MGRDIAGVRTGDTVGPDVAPNAATMRRDRSVSSRTARGRAHKAAGSTAPSTIPIKRGDSKRRPGKPIWDENDDWSNGSAVGRKSVKDADGDTTRSRQPASVWHRP